MLNKIDIQAGTPGRYDVLVNGDHYSNCDTRDAAIADAREAAGDPDRHHVIIRDFTTMGEGRTTSGVPFAIIPRKPQA